MVSNKTPATTVKRQTLRTPRALHRRIRAYCQQRSRQHKRETGKLFSMNDFMIEAALSKLEQEGFSGD